MKASLESSLRAEHEGGVAGFWQELWAQAEGKPWLQRLLRERGAALALRHAVWRERLRALSPGARRGVQRRLAAGLAGAALLLALGGGPSLAAPGGTIVVDGVVCTLADAITAANEDVKVGGCSAGSGADVLDLQADVTLTAVNNTTYGPTGLPVAASEVTIQGNGHTIQRSQSEGTPEFRILAVGSGGNLTLASTTVSGGSIPFNGTRAGHLGGGIYARSATVTVTNSTLSGNLAESGGGGVFASSGTVAVMYSTLSGNSARYGGGIAAGYAEVTVTNSTLSGNSARHGGGGISTRAGTVAVMNSTLGGNSAYWGGGIEGWFATVNVTNSTLSGNSASYGGGIYASSGTATVTGSTLSGNSASYGGGINAWWSATVAVTNSTLSGNSARFGGGGIYARSATVALTDSTLSGNSARDGGAVNARSAKVAVRNSTLSSNSAYWDGGGIQARYGAAVTVTGSTLRGNSASYGGGIRAWWSAAVAVTNSTLNGNSAASGGGIFVREAMVIVTNSTLSGNSADDGGGGIDATSSNVTVQSSIVAFQRSGGDCHLSGAVLTSGGYNIESGDSCGFRAAGDQQNVGVDQLKLQALADNGGPTPTMALREGSVAIDRIPDGVAGCEAGVSQDQRGYARAGGPAAGGTACDVGAYEWGSSPERVWLTLIRRE